MRDAANVHPALIFGALALLVLVVLAVFFSLPTTTPPSPITLAVSQVSPVTTDPGHVASMCSTDATWCARWVITGTSPDLHADRLRLTDETTPTGPLTCWSAPNKIARGPLHPGDALACGGTSTRASPGDQIAWIDTATGKTTLTASLL